MDKEVMNIEEAGKYLGVSKMWLYKACKEGKIPHTRFGKKYVFYKETLDEWLKEMTQAKRAVSLEPYKPEGSRGRSKRQEEPKEEA